ncbi:MAG TPA: hypothetical protein VJR92_08380 [Gemmatimonadaceae bacterium]|nr:hypothetical protein [Gemmatimonadaceae bacterium]
MTTFRSVVLAGVALASYVVVAPSAAAAQGGMQTTIQMQAMIEKYEKSREGSRVDRADVILAWYKQNPEQRPVIVVVDDDDDQGKRGRGRGRGGGHMPPGWEKKLAKHGELPGDLRARVIILPAPLVRTLPALPRGQEYVIIGNRVCVVERSSYFVLDILVTL